MCMVCVVVWSGESGVVWCGLVRCGVVRLRLQLAWHLRLLLRSRLGVRLCLRLRLRLCVCVRCAVCSPCLHLKHAALQP